MSNGQCMTAVKGKDTKLKMVVRRFLFSKRLRYRVNNSKLSGSSDIVLKKYKTIIFIDGCFWHGHGGCKYYRLPKTNVNFWHHKIYMNIARDYSNNVDLKLAGLRVIRIWECEIKTKAKRNTALEALYLDIISKTTEYSKQDTNANIAAEPIGPL